ncbi:MAG: hypothetical protein GX545_05100 [Fibrobacter sp.]|jgi:hypothetical protein|nr:hypothetical protein [Fibrobacter sp.]
MLSKKKKWLLVIFLFLIILGGAYLFFLPKKASYSLQEAACIFNELPEHCLDSSKVWNQGITFFDNELKRGRDTLAVLKSLLYEEWGIEFVKDSMNALSSLFPLEVLSSKKSGCMGASFLALMVAEEKNFPLEVIMLPNHVFLRYHGINFEPNREGFSYSNQEYAEKYKNGIWTGLEWTPLSKKEFLGLVAFNAGNVFLRESPKEALSWFKLAGSMFPEYPGIINNRRLAQKMMDL